MLETGEKVHPLGLFKANQSFTTTFYRPREGDRIGFQVTVRTNNLGYLSERPYRIERTSDEYRVVVIGDSYTGPTTMSSPWVDRVEDILNADALLRNEIGDRAIRVFNLGWPGAGFPHFQRVLEKKALQFDPDLVVVNYIELDFPRLSRYGENTPGNTIIGGLATMSVNDTPQTRFYTELNCSEPPVTLRNPMCYQEFNIFIGDDFPLRPEMLIKVYDLIADEYLVGKAVFTLFPYGYHKIIGNITGYNEYRQPDIFRFSPISHDKMINHAIDSLRAIKKGHPNVLFTLHPIFDDFFNEKKGARLTDEVLENAPDLEVVKMRDRLPIKGLSKDDIKQWYNLPYDGHMSDKGGRVYAKVFAELLASHIRKTALSSAKNSTLQPNPGEASK